jgi:hypothetical protein
LKIDQFEEFRAQIAASAAAVTDIAQPLVASMQPVLDAQRVLADALAPTIHQVEPACGSLRTSTAETEARA